MSKMEIFEPPMCCSTGICGSSVDPELLRIAAVIHNLQKVGIEAARHNLSSEPAAFMQNKDVSDILSEKGADVLPLTVIDGKIVKTGGYPTNEEFAKLLGVPFDAIKPATKVKVNKCGCGSKGCCS